MSTVARESGSHTQFRGSGGYRGAASGVHFVDVPPSLHTGGAPAPSDPLYTGAPPSRTASSDRRRTRSSTQSPWSIARRWDEVRRLWRHRRLRGLLLALVLALLLLVVSVHQLLAALAKGGPGAASLTSERLTTAPTPWRPRTPADEHGWFQEPADPVAQLASLAPEVPPDTRIAHPSPLLSDIGTVEHGAVGVEEPRLLPGVVTRYRLYSPEELLSMYANMTIVYTFVNGTEPSHAFRRAMLDECGTAILASERRHFAHSTLLLLSENWTNHSGGKDTDEAAARSTTTSLPPWSSPQAADCFPSSLAPVMVGGAAPSGPVRTILSLTRHHIAPNTRDRESDELRHSFRSVEAHMLWHTGRVVVVSPGHQAQWVDRAKNFLASRCTPASVLPRTSAAGRNTQPHVRVTTVHQDAVLPYGMRLTLNSHTIEKYLWRVRNMTSVHLYFNDDYFVNRDTAITDFLNPFGGTIIRTERQPIKTAAAASPDNPRSWDDAVGHTVLFTTMEVDVYPEDHLSNALVSMWHTRQMTRLNLSQSEIHFTDMPAVEPPPLERTADLAVVHKPDTLPPQIVLDAKQVAEGKDPANPQRRPITPQYVVAHAPFTYCTNMFRYLATRYSLEYISQMTSTIDRSSMDLLAPFIYNAFITTRPWAASPSYLRYVAYKHMYHDAVESAQQWQRLLQKKSSSKPAPGPSQGSTAPLTSTPTPAVPTPLPGWEYPPQVEVQLDNDDGCAPATQLAGFSQSQTLFTVADDDPHHLEQSFERIRKRNPLFFNINADFSKDEIRAVMRKRLSAHFPHPSYLEDGKRDDDGVALRRLYESLMTLPLVLVTSYANGACPLVRSLQLSLPDHRGRVWVVVHGSAAGDDVAAADVEHALANETLSAARRRLRHRVYSGMPVLRCTFRDDAVRVVNVSGAASLRAEVSRLVEGGSGGDGAGWVELPDTCKTVDGDEGRRVRVRGFVVDARARAVPPMDYMELVHALAMPGQTLALEDFDVSALGGVDGAAGDAVLSLSVTQAAARSVHWIHGASESDLLLTYPLPVEKYENMDARVRWLNKESAWESSLNAEDV